MLWRVLIVLLLCDTTDCKFCNSLTEDQRIQLATPSYKLKKEKREAKMLEAS